MTAVKSSAVQSTIKKSLGAAVLLVLAACGGGGGGSGGAAAPTAGTVAPGTANAAGTFNTPGIFRPAGNANGALYETVFSVLPTGEVYAFVYKNAAPFGVLHGTITGTGASFTTNDLTGYGYQVQNGGGIVVNQAISAGTVSLNSASITFQVDGTTVTANSAVGQVKNGGGTLYDNPLPLAGNYTARVNTVGFNSSQLPSVPVTIAADNSFTATAAGCTINGQITDLAAPNGGKAIKTATATFGGAGCSFNGQTVQGISTQVAAGDVFIQMISPDGQRQITFEM